MPAIQTGQPYRLAPNRWGLRYYDAAGVRRRTPEKFKSKSAALAHYRDVVEPQLRGEPAPVADLTLAEFVPLYLERHAPTVRRRTIESLRGRLRPALDAFGPIPLRDLERMSGELASWHATLPARWRRDVMQALRQVLDAAQRWEYIAQNPAKLAGRNPMPPPRPIRAFTYDELEAITAELSPAHAPLPIFAAATGLRPGEWAVLERRDVDRHNGVLNVRRTISNGEIAELGKTTRSRRQVPLSPRALEALDAIPPRLDTPYLFPARQGGPLDLQNFRRRVWGPVIEASGVARPARIYDLRSTFASNALAAGVPSFELAIVMGTSGAMIERHYGTQLEGSNADIARRLGAFEQRATSEAPEAFGP